MGLSSLVDIYCHRTDKAIADIPVQKLVNNGLVMGSTMKQLMGRVLCVFDACYVNGIAFSKKSQINTTSSPNR